jgi:hydrogenase maturation protein HypF
MAISEDRPGPRRARYALRVRGTVQGVGFRPAVARIARRAQLAGFVRNDSEGVWIEVEGSADALAAFPETIRREVPSMARLAQITSIEPMEVPVLGDIEFRITSSESASRTRAIVPPDAATCDACVGELFDPHDRRFRYPFINCTDCGPRFTIVKDLPYDREKTTMSAFAMCACCTAEYEGRRSRSSRTGPFVPSGTPPWRRRSSGSAGEGSSRSRGSAATSSPSMQGTPRRSNASGRASDGRTSHLPSWVGTWRR